MNKNILTALISLFTLTLQAQNQLINNGATIKVQNGAHLKVNNGGINNKNSGAINNSGVVYLDMDFSQLGGATYTGTTSSWLQFKGNANQNLSSDAVLNIARLSVNNGTLLILGNHANVPNGIDLNNNGSIQLGNFNLYAANTPISNYNAANYIITNGTGALRHDMVPGDIYEFPVGNNGYNPVVLLSNSGANELFAVRVEDAAYENGTSGAAYTQDAVNRSWHITEATAGGNNIDIAMEWDAAEELTNFDRAQSGIAHWNGTTWDVPAAYGGAIPMGGTRYSQVISGQTSFSPFIIVDTDVDLPIELISFDAKRKNSTEVVLTWATANELNNSGFHIERMLENETVFQSISFVEGKGTTTNTSYYQFLDLNAYTGVAYYRLKQVDFDGTATYSETRAVAGTGSSDNHIAAFPNPVKDKLTIRLDRLPAEVKTAKFQVVDILGQVVYELNTNIESYQVLEMDCFKTLMPATYILVAEMNNGERFFQEMVKQ